jgi:hypothetical protein
MSVFRFGFVRCYRSLEGMYVACLCVKLDFVCLCYCVVVFLLSPFELSSFVCIVKNCIVDNGGQGSRDEDDFL